VSPLRGEKPQNWPLSKLNTGRFALRAMLPVTRNRKETQKQYSSNSKQVNAVAITTSGEYCDARKVASGCRRKVVERRERF